jgi:hypothetical protein
VVTYPQVAAEFPRLAAELAHLSGEDREAAVRRVVEAALAATSVEVTSTSADDVERLVWSLDDVAWKLQEEAEQGRVSQAQYIHAFRRARAAGGLFDLLTGRFGSAVSEATYALGANEDAVLQLVGRPS